MIPVEEQLKQNYNGLPKDEKPVLLFKEKGDILYDKGLEGSEKNESRRVPCVFDGANFNRQIIILASVSSVLDASHGLISFS